jgi:CubicO group peptidase (beta-lactamase class C family)
MKRLSFWLAWMLILLGSTAPAAAQDTMQLHFQMAAEYSRVHHGEAVLVRMDDQVVFEDYRNSYRVDKPHQLTSGTKSFACVVALAAQADGLLTLDEPVVKTISEFQRHPLKSQITIRQLLNQTSGLEPAYRALNTRFNDQYAAALDAAMLSAPGEVFRYGPSHLALFGEVMRRKLKGEDLVDYLDRRIFKPIGIQIGSWSRDSAENPILASGVYMTARDWALYGQFILNRGRWGREQIIPPESLVECFQGSRANPKYGLTFWLPSGPWKDVGADRTAQQFQQTEYLGAGTPDVMAAMGVGNQRLYIIPALNMVVVRYGWDDPTWVGADFLSLILYGRLAS